MLKNITNPNNPIVFLDISIEDDYAGRVIIELRKDVVPRTVENFRALCTGEKGIGKRGKLLCYKGIKLHKAMPHFMVQGGDIINNDGTSGESIYGGKFADENFSLSHYEGAVSMVNEGRPDTNSSQFFIATVPCSHLDGINVVFGRVVSGFDIFLEIDKCDRNAKNQLLVECLIQDCGEIAPGDDWGIFGLDGTEDTLPQYPCDWNYDKTKITPENLIKLLEKTKDAGNWFYNVNRIKAASRKYKKAIRYINWFADIVISNKPPPFENGKSKDDVMMKLCKVRIQNIMNLAATEFKMNHFKDVLFLCDETLKFQSKNAKAYYRRGQANLRLHNYERAIEDLKAANKLMPNDRYILAELKRANDLNLKYNKYLKSVYGNMFG